MNGRWLKQTSFYDPADAENPNKGNCTEAAVASLLGVAMPGKFGSGGSASEFWDDFDAFFDAHGYAALLETANFCADVLYLASGPSGRGCSHMVVMRAGKLVHDPHPSNGGILHVEHVWLIVPIDPTGTHKQANSHGAGVES